MLVVPDASVILKWVLEREREEDAPKALQVLDAFLAERIDISLPTLWRYEVGNILGLKQPELAGELMKALLGYEFQEEPLGREYCLAVLDHMLEMRGATFYDSAYHVLAIRLNGQYVTADEDYVKRSKRKGHIALLVDWHEPKVTR
jgi:predicted nucleic acid-binding protein